MKTLREYQVEAISDYLYNNIWSNNWHWQRLSEGILHIIKDEEIKYRLRREEADALSHEVTIE